MYSKARAAPGVITPPQLQSQAAQTQRIALIQVLIVASPFGPREQRVQQLFQILATPALQPVYVHCLVGRDRTGC